MRTTSCLLLFLTLQLNTYAANPPAEDFVAHEWGTFTSVQGADGIQLEWNPLVTSELPDFVYNPSKPSGDPRRHLSPYGGKSAFRTLQRMETPVIYFYSAKERNVDVTVKFPQGFVTEWFPQARDIGPAWIQPRPLLSKVDDLIESTGAHPALKLASLDTRHGVPESLIRWTGVDLRPAKANPAITGLLPADQSGSHYYAARETDADFLRVNGSINGTNVVEHEKFLFYRGIGNFQAPLQVTMGSSEDEVQLRNNGKEELADLIVLKVRHGEREFTLIPRLAPGEERTARIERTGAKNGSSELNSEISRQMENSLVTQGLYPREAAAMVHTWQDSWFAEEGLRVLYILPRKWTDGILPLTLEPAPKELVRVMIGRAEIITPDMEWQLLRQIVKFSGSSAAERPQVVAETRALGLGRFAEPAVRRVLGKMPSREFSQQAWNLLEAIKPQPKQGQELAAR